MATSYKYTIVKASIPEEVRARKYGTDSRWRDIRNTIINAEKGETFRVNLPNRDQMQRAQSAVRNHKMKRIAPNKKFKTMSNVLDDGTYDLYIEVLS